MKLLSSQLNTSLEAGSIGTEDCAQQLYSDRSEIETAEHNAEMLAFPVQYTQLYILTNNNTIASKVPVEVVSAMSICE